jgi:hypothetical protein
MEAATMTSKPRLREPIEYHDVMVALSRATAALALLDELTNSKQGLWHPSEYGHSGATRKDARAWTIDMAVNALADALREARDAFRKSLTPEQAKEQVICPTAVA